MDGKHVAVMVFFVLGGIYMLREWRRVTHLPDSERRRQMEPTNRYKYFYQYPGLFLMTALLCFLIAVAAIFVRPAS